MDKSKPFLSRADKILALLKKTDEEVQKPTFEQHRGESELSFAVADNTKQTFLSDMKNQSIMHAPEVDKDIDEAQRNVFIEEIEEPYTLTKLQNVPWNAQLSPTVDSTITEPANSEPYVPKLNNEMILNESLSEEELISLGNDTESSSAGRPKKGRKRKYADQNRIDRKKNKNSNKTYFNYKGVCKVPKIFNSSYRCSCIMKCSDSINEIRCRSEFERFWCLGSYDAQTTFIAACVSEAEKKRTYGRDTDKRKFSRVYKLDGIRVCREMFCKTLSVTPCRVNTALKKFNGRIPLTDQRGHKQGGSNKLSEEKIQIVVDNINKFPRYTSHYCRNGNNNKFLAPDMTIQRMYDVYGAENSDPVSFASYKKIFYEKFNLRCKPLKKDTCNICDGLKTKIDFENNVDVKQLLTEQHDTHLKLAEEARNRMKDDLKTAKEDKSVECLTFDLQKTLPLPRIPTNLIFYKRQIWVYNCGVHSGKNVRDYCYTWVEGTAGKGAQEVGSCLLKHITSNLSQDVQHLILWCDTCGGQNRNIKLTLILKSILQSSLMLESITIKFLYSGHSFLPNDTAFSDIESALKHQQRIYLPSDYEEIMKCCRKKKPLNVIRMCKKDFFGSNILEKKIVNRKISDSNVKINWLHVRQIKIVKSEPFHLFFKQHNFSSEELTVNIKKHTRNSRPTAFKINELSLLWPAGKPILSAKLQDIMSIKHLIPQDAIDFYNKLTVTTDIEEDVDGFNVQSLDFDAEVE